VQAVALLGDGLKVLRGRLELIPLIVHQAKPIVRPALDQGHLAPPGLLQHQGAHLPGLLQLTGLTRGATEREQNAQGIAITLIRRRFIERP
jgi:hypothetical protein